MKQVDVKQVAAFLNELLESDREFVTELVQRRVPCNEAIAEHPTLNVSVPEEGRYTAGPIGLLNGLFGEVGVRGPICMCIDDNDGRIVRFDLAEKYEV